MSKEEQQQQITKLQNELNIPEGECLALERRTRNSLYKDALREIWNKGGIAAFSLSAIEEIRNKFAISQFDYPAIEVELIREMRKNKVKATILVVDEDETVLTSVKGTLRANSFAVLVAKTVGEALEIVKSVRPDVILSEVTFRSVAMGFDFFQQIRSAAFTKDIFFCFMTSQLDRTTKLVGERLGVDDFFVKPIDYELLFEAIDGKLQRSSSSGR
jgi:PleD family two-component response regulator